MDVNLIVILIIAALNAYTARMSWKTNKNVALVERATNSMKDALVASTARASHAEGTAEGLKAGTAAGLQQGRDENNNK